MEKSNWVVSWTRLIVGIVVCVILSVSGIVVSDLLNVDIGVFRFLPVGVGVLAFCLITLRRPEGK